VLKPITIATGRKISPVDSAPRRSGCCRYCEHRKKFDGSPEATSMTRFPAITGRRASTAERGNGFAILGSIPTKTASNTSPPASASAVPVLPQPVSPALISP
jgi:hypothetical protein